MSDILFMMELVATTSEQEDTIHILAQTSRLVYILPLLSVPTIFHVDIIHNSYARYFIIFRHRSMIYLVKFLWK